MDLLSGGSSTFTKETFLASDFDADAFIAEQRKLMALESLRNELAMFLKVINTSVVELINRDYADFLNLSSHLLSVENLLTGIQQPTEHLKSQIVDLRAVLQSCISEFSELLKRKTEVEQQRRCCERLRELVEAEKKLVEIRNQRAFRDVNEFHRIVSLIQKAEVLHDKTRSNALSRKVGERVRLLATQFDTELDSAFRSALLALSASSEFSNGNTEQRESISTITTCLHCYLTLNGGEKRVEAIFREAFVSNALSEFVNERFIEQHGLEAVYSRVEAFCNLRLSNLQAVIIEQETQLLQRNQTVVSGSSKAQATNLPFRSVTQQFDLVSLVLGEFVSKLDAPRGGVSSVFGIGDPDAFQRCFSMSLAFLERVETCVVEQCVSVCSRLAALRNANETTTETETETEKLEAAYNAVQRLRQCSWYTAFMSKWNLFVYFELRFQSIGSRLEKALANAHEAKQASTSNETQFRTSLTATDVLIESISQCWSDGVYLDVLASKFWKLTLQLNSRYIVAMRNETLALNLHSGHTPFGNTLSDNVALIRALRLLNDLSQLASTQLRSVYQKVIRPRILASCAPSSFLNESVNETALDEAINEFCETLSTDASALHKTFVEYVVACGCLLLKQTSEIPRLYRKTNRAAPNRASSHITDAVDMLQRLNEAMTANLTQEKLGQELLTAVANDMCGQFAVIAEDLLESVRKMEDTLKRLRRSRTMQTSLQNAGSHNEVTDDDKIRMQLALDISTFVHKLTSELHLDASNMAQVCKLAKLCDHLQQHLRNASD